MKSIITKALLLIFGAAALCSFSPNFGGEGFEIFLNGKVILQQFGKDLNTVKTLQLDAASTSDKLAIRYHHCGRVGKNRVVTIKDGQDKMLKEWRFSDVAEPVAEMSCYISDIPALKKSNTVLKVFYASTELPGGRQLATLVTANNAVAGRVGN
jgi:hypothetical protein